VAVRPRAARACSQGRAAVPGTGGAWRQIRIAE